MADDAALLRQLAEGDEQAFGAFYDRWNPLVNAVALRILRQRDDVEKVVEETFWQVWRQTERYEVSRNAVQTWLLTIARSRALERRHTRKQLRENPLDDDIGDVVVQGGTESNLAMNVESTERRRVAIAALAELPAEQRAVLELAYFEGLSQSEIADRTGQPLGTIKARVRSAMQKLKGRLFILREEAR